MIHHISGSYCKRWVAGLCALCTEQNVHRINATQLSSTQIDMTAAKVVADIEANLVCKLEGIFLLRNYHAFKHGEITDNSH